MDQSPGSALAAVPAWTLRRGRWARGGIAMLAGAAMTLGHAPVDLPWAFLLAVPLVIWCLDAAPSGRAAFWTGWCAGFGYFVTGMHWIGHAFLVDADQFLWLLPFAVTLLPAGLALFWGVAALAARRLFWSDGPLRVLAFAAALMALEYARSHVLTGLPWALPGYVWVETPVMQAASWAGPHGMTLLTLALTGLPLVALAGARHRLWPGAAALGALAALWGAGVLRVPAEVAYAPDAPLIRVVQPNATQELKWQEPWETEFYQRLLTLSAEPAERRPDAIIWPETAVSFLPAYEPDERARIGASGGGALMILGALHGERAADGGETYWNSLFALGPEGEILTRYDKHHLVPFGEYLPLAWLLRAIGLTELAQRGGFATGPGPQLVALPGLPPFAPLICYELIFPDEVIPEAGRPAWLLQVTNDAWFGNFAGPQQHLAQARIRAIEFGLPVVRSANTGVSAVIGPFGQLISTRSLGNIGYIDERLPEEIEPTTYSRYGDLPALSLGVIILALAVYSRKSGAAR